MNALCQQALDALPNGLPIKRAMLARHIPDLTTLAQHVRVSPEVVFRFLQGVQDTQTVQISAFLGLDTGSAVPGLSASTSGPRLSTYQHIH